MTASGAAAYMAAFPVEREQQLCIEFPHRGIWLARYYQESARERDCFVRLVEIRHALARVRRVDEAAAWARLVGMRRRAADGEFPSRVDVAEIVKACVAWQRALLVRKAAPETGPTLDAIGDWLESTEGFAQAARGLVTGSVFGR